jgi:hypothetical protein
VDGLHRSGLCDGQRKGSRYAARALYEDLYCGEAENRIGEQFELFARSGVVRHHAGQSAAHDRDGTIAGFIGRAIGQETPKLVFPNGFRPKAYIFNATRVTGGDLYLVRDPPGGPPGARERCGE